MRAYSTERSHRLHNSKASHHAHRIPRSRRSPPSQPLAARLRLAVHVAAAPAVVAAGLGGPCPGRLVRVVGLGHGGGAGTAGWQVWIGALELPAWLAPWLPAQSLEAVKAMLAASAPMIEWAVASAPALMAWLPTLVLVFWGVGAVLLVLAGVALSVAVGIWRRRVQPALAGTR
ncbi:hypothetical protein [Ottowia caeni]|uniref:hypothetical protein n=1 Tax=Ottowia caeni TaxID=2870339 RepID=UPI003D73E535